MTDPVLIIDCAYPPATYPTSWNGKPIKGCCVYIGGNTPHVWTDAEIARMMAQPGYEYIVPIFTRSNPTGAAEAVSDAMAAAKWATAHKQPKGTYLMVDAETAVNSPYYTAFDTTLKTQAGLLEIIYGSKATVTKNVRTSGGYDEAQWNFQDTVPSGADAAQFADYPLYDVNAFAYPEKLWNFRSAATVSAPAPTKTVTPTEEDDEDMSAQAVNGQADLSWSTGTKHVVQVSYDLAGLNKNLRPTLRVVLQLETGPLVLVEKWTPTPQARTIQFGAHTAAAYGICIQHVSGGTAYAVSVS